MVVPIATRKVVTLSVPYRIEQLWYPRRDKQLVYLFTSFARKYWQENSSILIGGMLSKPSTHFLISPSPFKGMGVPLVIFWPSRFNVIAQGLATVPRAALEVVKTKRLIEQFSLIKPGGMGGCEARPPPGIRFEIISGSRRRMAGIPVLDQKHAAQVRSLSRKMSLFQF
jgi:hypothetical protein